MQGRLCFTVGRGPVPRHASIGTGNGWLAFGFRAGRVIAGDRPPRYGMQGRFCFTVGRGPVPRHASIGRRNSLGRWTMFAQVDRSRGTGPRATMKKRAAYRRARACPSPCLDRQEKRLWAVGDFRADRTLAGETLSHARVACEGPRATGPEGFSSRTVGP